MPTINDVPKEARVNLKEKTVLVYDNGLFVETAKTLAKSFKKVYYYMPWKSAFPKSNQYIVGVGIEGIERIWNFWDYFSKIDLFVFPDVYDGDLQKHLVSLGKNVWGGRKGEEMELYRDKMKQYMQKLGLYVTPYAVVKGTENLRAYLKEHENVHVKINMLRGNFESFKSDNYKSVEPKLDEIEYILGAMKTELDFIVEDNYDGCEVGADMYSIDGQYPTETLAGIEVKDLGYVGKFLKYKDLSPKVVDFNTKIAPALKAYGYRGFMSTEIRINDKEPYMVDFCARQASPPGELYQIMYENLAEIIWYGAQGYLIDPVVDNDYGVEALIHSSWADKNWQPVEFPEAYRDNIKLRNACKIEGKYYCVPQAVGLPEIGAIVAEGKTLDEAVDKVKEIAEQVTGYYIEAKVESIDKALEEFEKLEEYGVKIL